MFTQPCFIRKNAEELHKNLEVLGYHKFEFCRDDFEDDDVLSVTEMDNGEPIYTYISYDNMKSLGYIDCGTNKKMFLALAALRDDTDKYQWFVDGDFWVFCRTDEFHYIQINLEDVMQHQDWKDSFHKATPQEIIEHFKVKES